MPIVGQREIRMPFMDRDLVEFLTAIPEEQLLRPRFRRSLLRRSLAATVPAEILNRRQKAGVVRGAMVRLAEYMSATAESCRTFDVARYGYTNSDRLWEAIRQAATIRPDNLVGILRIVGLEHWLRDSFIAFSRAGCTLAPHTSGRAVQEDEIFRLPLKLAERRL